jgi:hypothetical protein
VTRSPVLMSLHPCVLRAVRRSEAVPWLMQQVLRIDKSGKTNKVYIKRRDLLRRNRLLPRDLRRIDPSLSVVKTSPSINIKDHALLINLGGVRCAPRPAPLAAVAN